MKKKKGAMPLSIDVVAGGVDSTFAPQTAVETYYPWVNCRTSLAELPYATSSPGDNAIKHFLTVNHVLASWSTRTNDDKKETCIYIIFVCLKWNSINMAPIIIHLSI